MPKLKSGPLIRKNTFNKNILIRICIGFIVLPAHLMYTFPAVVVLRHRLSIFLLSDCLRSFLHKEIGYVILREIFIAVVNEAVIDQFQVGKRVEDLTRKIAFEKFACVPTIGDFNR